MPILHKSTLAYIEVDECRGLVQSILVTVAFRVTVIDRSYPDRS